MKTGDFYSSGKLLLTGEYLVMYGALALAIPLKKGQHMSVTRGESEGRLDWKARMLDKDWFSAEFDLPGFNIISASDQRLAEFLKKLLQSAAAMRPEYFTSRQSFTIQTNLEFDIRWGLGSSSSLVSNIALWLELDPYLYFSQNFPGSGYDVFCARSKKPILYRLIDGQPEVSPTPFRPTFLQSIYFVYLGTKQDSQESVVKFKSSSTISEASKSEISDLTVQLANTGSLEEFMKIISMHEEIMSAILGIQAIGPSRFFDFPGAIKSLGAWGGDFIMAVSSEPQLRIRDYFASRGLEVIFPYTELALDF